jgi:hypothetical protein
MNRMDINHLHLDYSVKMWDKDYDHVGIYSPFGISTNGTRYGWCHDYPRPITQSNWLSLKYVINGMTNGIARTLIGNDTQIGTTFVAFPTATYINTNQQSVSHDESDDTNDGSVVISMTMVTLLSMICWPTYVDRILRGCMRHEGKNNHCNDSECHTKHTKEKKAKTPCSVYLADFFMYVMAHIVVL